MAQKNEIFYTSNVRKWGNGHGILIPKAFVDTLKLDDACVTTTLRGDSLILTKLPATKKTPLTLADMVRGRTEKDRHSLIEYGAPVGREVW